PRAPLMNKRRLSILLATGSLVMGSCSMFDSRNNYPYCGEPIDVSQVQLADMSAYNLQESRIQAALQEQFGNYRLVTDKPVQVPRDYAYWNRDQVNGIAGAKAE